MIGSLERLKIRLAVAFAWSKKARMSQAIQGFQATEADGVWHLHRGLARVRDARHQAILFSHSLEEERHAEEFAFAYRHYGERALPPPAYERKDLYGPTEPAWKTFAFVHVGEADATDRFRCIQQALGKGVLKDSLARIVSDEEGHVDLTHHMLVQMGATDREIRAEVRRVRLLRLWQGWLRTGKRVIGTLATVLLSLSYFLIGPLLFLFARRRLRSRFVEYDNCRLKKL